MTRKLPIFAALSAVLFFLSVLAERPAFARLNGATTLTTVTQPDIVCYGGSNQGTANTATEVCLDYSGNVIPTTDNAQQSGSSTLRWKDIEAVNLNSGGGNLTAGTAAATITAAGNQTLGTVGTANGPGTGNATMPTLHAIVGSIQLKSQQVGTSETATTGIYVSTTIPVLSTYEILVSSGGGNIKLTSTPTISTITLVGNATAIPDGTFLVLTSTTAQVITLQSQGTLSGSGLRLGSATRAITIGNTLTLIWNAAMGQWLEIAFSAGTGN